MSIIQLNLHSFNYIIGLKSIKTSKKCLFYNLLLQGHIFATMRRREFNLAVGGGAITLLAGCAGNGAGGNAGAPFDTSFEEGSLIATFSEDTNIDFLQIIGPDGSEVGLPHLIEGAETRKSLMNMGDLSEFNDETLEIVAFNEEENELGSVEVTYAPDLEVVGMESDNQAQEFISNIENVGTGPDIVSISMEVPVNQVQADPAEVRTSGDPEVNNRSSEISVVTSQFGDNISLGELSSTRIPGGEQRELTIAYEFSQEESPEGFGTIEDLYANRGSIEDVEDIDEDFSISGELSLKPRVEPDERYNIEIIINGLETEIIPQEEFWEEEEDNVPYEIVYTPIDITVGEVTKIEESDT